MNAPSGFLPALEAAFRAAGRDAPAVTALEPVSGGSINQAFRLRTREGDFFCKWNAAAPADFFAREAEGLEALRAAGTSLIIPRVVACFPAPSVPSAPDAPEPDHPGRTDWPGGDPVVDDGNGNLAGGDGSGPRGGLLVTESLAPARPGPADWEAFGRALAALHAAPQRAFGWARDNYLGLTPQANGWSVDWPAFFAGKRIAPLVERLAARGDLSAGSERIYARLIDRMPSLLAHRPAPSLIHGDLWRGNFLPSDRGPALVDPAAHCADAEAEWAMMDLFGGFPGRVRAAYGEARPLPPGWRERRPLYRLYHLLNHAVIFGGSYGAQALSDAESLT